MVKTACLLAAGLLGVLVPVRSPETYTIRFKKAQKGDCTLVTKHEEQKTQVQFAADGANGQSQETSETADYVYRETILEIPEGKDRPTRLRRQYTKAEVKTGGKAQVLAYQGKTVLIEKKDGKYQFRIEEGKALTGKEAEYLNREFNRTEEIPVDFNRLLLPRKAVRVKESWPIDLDTLTRTLGKAIPLEFDRAKSSGTGRLLRVYHKGRRLFGEFDLRMELAGKSIKMGDTTIPLKPPCKLTLTAKMDACIDGSQDVGTVHGKMDFHLAAALPLGENKNKVTMTAQATFRESHQVPRK
jgi:hypothetical protein